MRIFEIIVPGIQISHDDHEWARQMDNLLRHLGNHFHDANLALNWFMAAQQENLRLAPTKEEWMKKSQRRLEIEDALLKEIREESSRNNREIISLEVDRRFKKERLEAGILPDSMQHRIAFIHARSFLYALDGFRKILKVLAEEIHGAPESLKDIYRHMEDCFPDLKGVRDTSQHLEKRARFLDRNHKPLKTKILAIGNLMGSRYESTMNNGLIGKVDISIDSMSKFQEIFQAVLFSFKWRGPKQLLPRD